jgi:hypothetical protein
MLLMLAAAHAWACDHNGTTRQRLFHITRSKNVGIVCYDVVVKNGKLCEDEPVDVYWEHPDKHNEREELNWIERWQAYGVDITRTFSGLDSVDIVMRANKKSVRIVKRNGHWIALTYINKKVCQLLSIHVATDESTFPPKVLFVRVTGAVRRSGEVVEEVIRP